MQNNQQKATLITSKLLESSGWEYLRYGRYMGAYVKPLIAGQDISNHKTILLEVYVENDDGEEAFNVSLRLTQSFLPLKGIRSMEDLNLLHALLQRGVSNE